MKRTAKLLRIVALAAILALLVAALPAAPVLAAEDITVDPDEGEIGEEIEVEGDGFEESTDTSDFYVTVYFTDEKVDEGDDIDDLDNYEEVDSSDWVNEDGEFDTKFKVPDELTEGDEGDAKVSGGDYYVFVTEKDDDEILAWTDFTVRAAEISLDPDDGTVGTEVEISGVDFEEDDYLTVEYDSDELDIESGDDYVDDSDGEFTLTVIIPESTADEHTITVTDESDNSAEATFTVKSKIELSKTSGAAGESITVSGTGFGKDVDVTIDFDGTEVQTSQTDDDGSFSAGFTLPTKAPGTYEIEAQDEDKNKAEANLTMAAGVTLGQTTGNVGSQVTINGTGFTTNASVQITYDGAPLTSATADANGKFSATATVPESTHGQHTITASDGTNTVSAAFTMESTPPPIPMPELPLMDTKAKSQAFFDWGDVTDDSGVTYTIQIATSEDFSSSSLVLEKTGLTESEYTLTKEERLKSTGEEAPYYWRLQAVDGAGNESGWTTPGAFYVGFSFEFGGWVLYTLMAIAGILVLAVGFLLGRRTSYL